MLNPRYDVLVADRAGCESTSREALHVIDYLRRNGHRFVASAADADYVIINTCAFLQTHRSAITVRLESLGTEAPDAEVIIMGCARDIAPEMIERFPIALALGHGDLQRLDEIFHRTTTFDETPSAQWSEGFERFLVTVGRGCAQRCSYCSIKQSIGHIESRPIAEIISDFHYARARRQGRILLAGDDLGSYGLDIGLTLPALLDAIMELEGSYDVLLSNIHPKWFLKYFDTIARFLGSPHASKWLFLPIQSGSDEVLAHMLRGYRIADVEEAIDRLIELEPEVRFYYDFIIGYPTETEEAFNATLSFVNARPPSEMMVASYSTETGTAAAELAPFPRAVIKERLMWLRTMYSKAASLNPRVTPARWGTSGATKASRKLPVLKA